ncbi:MAG: T9SS type A sorting domain-containing protein [Balneola sp.]
MKNKHIVFLFALTAFVLAETQTYANTKQGNYRWRADNGNEANATFLADENIFTYKVINDTSAIRLRIEMYNDDARGNTGSQNFSLFYSTSNSAFSGTWTKITSDTSNDFVLANTTHFTNGDSQNADLLTDTENEGLGGLLIESSDSFAHNLVGGRSDEFEFSIKVTANVQLGDYYFTIRISDNATINAYDEIPKLTITEPFIGAGAGTEEDPYTVSSAAELNSVRTILNAYFVQTKDIDLDTTGYSSGEGWDPIGENSRGYEFQGVFDGNGFTIKNLFINRPSENFNGLFGATYDAELKNIALENVDITGDEYTGALVGINYSEVRKSYSTGSISGLNHTGGLVGANENYNSSNGLVSNSYSSASATSSNYGASALVGRLISGSIEYSYGIGSVIAPSGNGGLIGEKNSGTVTNSYWDTQTTGQSTSDGGTGLSTAQMKQSSNLTGFDFTDEWSFIDGKDYPYLKAFGYKKIGITGNEGWRMLSTPVTSSSFGTLLDGLWTQGFTGADVTHGTPNVLVWNEASKAFQSISNATDTPTTGTGFITYVFSDDNYDGSAEGFPKVLTNNGSRFSGTASPGLTFTDSGTLSNDGWNLLGNPYGTSINWDGANGWSRTNLDGTFYVWSDSAGGGAGSYLSWNGTTGTLEDGKIAPWQGFWVKANASSPSISMNDSVKSTGGTLFKQKPVPQLKFKFSGNEISNSSIVMFHEDAQEGKDEFDAYKLNSLNSEYLLLGTTVSNLEPMDIQALPLNGSEFILDLNINGTNLNGEFTLSWEETNIPADWEIILEDREEGTETWIKEKSSIDFILSEKTKSISREKLQLPATPVQVVEKSKKGTSRFVLRIRQSMSVNNESISELPKIVELEQNYPNPFNPTTTIEYGVPETGDVTLEVYDLLGRKVATLLNTERKNAGRYTVNFDASNLASGMYIYRLQVGNSVLIKKLTLIK